ncbi:LCP family protein [Cellulomonas sp. P22]
MTHVDMVGLIAEPSSTPSSAGLDDPGAGAAVTILLLGSDQRDGENAAIGGEADTMASDTVIVAHLSADRSRVELVSIPRDSMVRIPACSAVDGSTSKPRERGQFNEAFGIGWDLGGDLGTAAACTASTVTENTGVRIDHVAVVDFAGFQQMIGAIGGVDICIPVPMKDRYTGLDLGPGDQHLNGVVATQLARSRHIEGTDGSDLNRIGNQQRLLSAVLGEVLAKNVLTDVPELLSFLSAATSSLTTDNDLDVRRIAGLGYSMRGIGREQITFMTIPNGPDPADHDRVVWTDEADAVWAAMAQDLPVVPADETAPPPATDVAPAPATTSTSPALGTSPSPTTAPVAPVPVPTQTRSAGREPFTGADVTATCEA